MPPTKIPAYNSMMAAFRRAFHRELQHMIDELPLCAGDRVIDVGCGDGQYTEWLAARVAPGGQVTGVDVSPAFLRAARARAAKSPYADRLSFVNGRVPRLPFADGAFDLAWCAQSLFSLPDAVQTLDEMARVVRPGGIVAVLEEDTLHHVLLSWPIEIELLLREAEYRSYCRQKRSPARFYIGRELRQKFQAAGLRPQRRKTYALSREAPFGAEERKFIDAYLSDLLNRARPYLKSPARQKIDSILVPRRLGYLPARQDFSMTCIEHVMWGKKD